MSDNHYSEVFTIDQAAEYVGLSVNSFRKHIYQEKTVQPVFTKAELNRFIKARSAGKLFKRRSEDTPSRRIRALEKQVGDLQDRVKKLEQAAKYGSPVTPRRGGLITIDPNELPDAS